MQDGRPRFVSAFLYSSCPAPGSLGRNPHDHGGAAIADPTGLTVNAPQTRFATAAVPETTAPTIVTAAGDVGSTSVVLGFSKDVYCTGLSFDPTDFVITDNNTETTDPIIVAAGPNGCGVTPATADASFSVQLSAPLAAARAYQVFVTAEANEIQDTVGNDLANPSNVSFTTAAADFTPPTLIDTRVLSNLGTTDFADVGDSFESTFSETMSGSTFGGINLQDTDGTAVFLSCGTQVLCTWNTASTTITVTVTSALAGFGGVTPGLQLPANITTLNGFSDAQGNVPNVLGSTDRLVNNEFLTGPFASPAVSDSRVLSNLNTTDFSEPGDSFRTTFSAAMIRTQVARS